MQTRWESLRISQGTISVLIGCHSPVHSLLVLISWYKLYGKMPRLWEIVCIFLHDVGHWGLQYLDDFEVKKIHWKPSAEVAYKLFGMKGFLFLAGHCEYSGFSKSFLYRPDKYSWHIAPFWWLWLNTVTEPKLRMGYTRMEACRRFKSQVAESVESGEFRSSHDLYIERCKGKRRPLK